ncbi:MULTISPECIES: hypothetical protein [Lysinibacillus]|uniref:hypothetical protein n=1 Tax=Lysinibacillus TaxID=400634 RepID=UPI0021A3BB45|nr:hypothetical protein [Lysinibacillus capsici]MCT1540314.1 hypothetical protein [Lysinibacillus capsici]MCT1571382.1 hypothetical protein [Lysinibacillus capsici]MCT1647828.1 hypothetical protein [Lysinibacillus capsici]MCT1726369.1 hypothetical protein [Lysinibacillus capsici]MCT1783474.1 hypothetical protein [Lysinibacillus capsici]
MKRIYIGVMVVLVLMIIPITWWYLEDEKQLNVAIIDKTVPNESYREHLGVNWFLNHYKYRLNNEPYDVERDYYGTVPNDETKSVVEKNLPNDYSDYDVIYLADTYGVYKDDLQQTKRLGERSEKIVGGLEQKEWQSIVERLASKKKSMLIAEYNTFASPTSGEVRKELQDYLGITWSGWIGRYFDELDYHKNLEIPQWVIDEHGDNWSYKGGGFLLFNEITEELLVLEMNKHVNSEGIQVQFTENGKKFFHSSARAQYDYWFDIITPKYAEDALANYKWDLTKKGTELLKDNGIPEQFAAIVGQDKSYTSSYYFAGDFNDIARVPNIYKIKGLPTIYKYAEKYADSSFYWSIYIPVMHKIFDSFEHKEVQDTVNHEKLNYNARIQGQSFEVLRDGKWEPIVFKGVNIGMGKPGAFPGEAAITEEEYYRWFKQIADMNANTIRVYTLHPPGFYRALAKYNEEHPKKPLYVLHGVWINEEGLAGSLDAYDKDTLEDFQLEMKQMVDVVHGNIYVEPRPGHASGLYDVDVSKYVIGWVLGIEWYPHMVVGTNEKHANIGQYNGTFFETKGASPFEHWLAEQMDVVSVYEKEKYNWLRPMSFTNWVTTDILEHPSEPSKEEDLVGVNPNVIYTKGEMTAPGQFASYHVYPYYPDFFNFDKDYLNYVDFRGNKNSYAGYLKELHEAHTMPVLIAEFGIPASRGKTHDNVYGWNQGQMSEQAQGETLQHLFENIMHEGLMGGLVFTWQDEWFKRTWNTMDYDDPNRRPFWSNAQTNEQQFGLLSFDRLKVKVDGETTEWTGKQLYDTAPNNPTDFAVDYDERYLYIKLKSEELANTSPRILLDVVPGQGNMSATSIKNMTFSNGVDFIVELNKNGQSRVVIDEYYDFYDYLYGHRLNLVAPRMANALKNSGKFAPIYYVLNKQLFLPEQNRTTDFSIYETGKLLQGNANPEAKDYDSLVDYTWTDDNVIELRIPWLLIQAKDPSQREFIGNLYKDGDKAAVKVDNIYIGALFVDKENNVVQSMPAASNGVLPPLSTYTWETWQVPKYEERLKQSYYILQKLFKAY